MKFTLLLTILSLIAVAQANKFSFDNSQLASFMAKMQSFGQQPITTTAAPFVSTQNNQMFSMPQTQNVNMRTVVDKPAQFNPMPTQQQIRPASSIQQRIFNKQQQQKTQMRMAGQQQQKPKMRMAAQQQQKPQMRQQQQEQTTAIPQRELLDPSITNKCAGIENGKLIKHPTSTRKFVVCDADLRSIVVMDCPDNLLFNSFLERCDNHVHEPLKCTEEPCMNNGKCIDMENMDYKCECPVGWAGKVCDRKDVCSTLPCGSNGVCIPTPMGSMIDHFCLCSQGLQFGIDCQAKNVKKNPCFMADNNFHSFAVKGSPNAFVHCDGKIPHFKFCPSTLVFSTHTQSCVSMETMATEQPMAEMPTTAAPRLTSTVKLTAKYCKGHKMGDLKPHPQDKTMFVVCQSEAEFDIMKCPNSLVFNAHTLNCETSHAAPEMGCSLNPCENNGKCVDLPLFKYKCECALGFMGKNCERADVCATAQCGKNGVCLPLPTGSPINHFCLCEMGDSFGLTCNQQTTEPNPCLDVRSFNTQMFALKSNPGIFVHCDGQLPHLKFCQYPLVFSKAKQQCFWTID